MLRAPAALLSDPLIKASRPDGLALKWGGGGGRANTNLHGVTLQIRGEWSCCSSSQRTVPKEGVGICNHRLWLPFVYNAHVSEAESNLVWGQTAMMIIIARDLQK